jgi:hypothetical protein
MRQVGSRSKHEVKVVREVSEVRTREPASLGKGGKQVLGRTVLLGVDLSTRNIELFEGASSGKLLSNFIVL